VDVAVLLLLPVVGGYLFARTWNVTRYATAREDGHRLYFRAAFYAVVLFTISNQLRILLLLYFPWYRDFEKALYGVLEQLLKDVDKPYQIPLAIASVYAMFIAVPLGALLNIVCWKAPFLRKAVLRDDFERLLHDAVRRTVPIAVTMENRKVYVGFVLRTFDPMHARKSLALLPLVSGFRSENDGRLQVTTKYTDLYGGQPPHDGARRLAPPLQHLTIQDFEIVLPVDKIHSLGLFDMVAYARFNQTRSASEADLASLVASYDPPLEQLP